MSDTLPRKEEVTPEQRMFPLSSRQVERIIKNAGAASTIEKKS
ncbi:hypothetical protein ACFTAO_00510 [Paenibacillus rhizoplanae]